MRFPTTELLYRVTEPTVTSAALDVLPVPVLLGGISGALYSILGKELPQVKTVSDIVIVALMAFSTYDVLDTSSLASARGWVGVLMTPLSYGFGYCLGKYFSFDNKRK